MAEAAGSTNLVGVLAALARLGQTDALLFGVTSEAKRLEQELETRSREVERQEKTAHDREALSASRRAQYQKEEKKINEEREKLSLRRKALTTLSSYKLQQAASKEIALAEEGLGTQEGTIITLLDDAEKIGAEAAEAREKAKSSKAAWESWAIEARGTLETLYRRAEEYRMEREGQVPGIPANILVHYDRIRTKFPSNPVVAVANHSCTACFMAVGPQLVLQIRRGAALVRCPGCARILTVDEPAAPAST